MGALRADQDAPGGRRSGRRRAPDRAAQPFRLPPLYRLRRVRIAARNEGPDRARGEPQGHAGGRQTGRRRHPRSGIHRPGVSADPRRPAAQPARPEPDESAADAGGGGHAARGRGRRTGRRLCLSARCGAPPAGGQRPPDPAPARRRTGLAAPHLRHGFLRPRAVRTGAAPPPGAGALPLQPGDRRPPAGSGSVRRRPGAARPVARRCGARRRARPPGSDRRAAGR